jgi:GTP-binding protein
VRATPKVFYATQVSVAPPTIVLFVNNPDYLDENYRRFVTNRFRELLPYAEVPIKVQVRGRSRTDAAKGVGAMGGGKPGRRVNKKNTNPGKHKRH